MDRIGQTKTCIAIGLLALAACQVDEPERSQVPPPTPTPVAPEPEPVPMERIHALLDRGDAAFRDDRLLHPVGDSALTHYLTVLDLVPEQADALRGIERIVERFIERAQEAIRRQRWATARSMLDRARLVDADHPALPSLFTQLQQLRNAERLMLNLSTAAVQDRAVEAADALAAFGPHARKRNARVFIRAGSDAQGRWMYAQLNRAPGERRIRAEMEIGWPPRVVVLLFREADSAERGP